MLIDKYLSIGIWNTQWKASSSLAGRAMTQLLLSQSPDIVCITEGHLDQMPPDWHSCSSASDFGYPLNVQSQRKVVMFSRNPWRDIDSLGSIDLPPGRFVSATTDTKVGPIHCVGVCVPWHGAHVSTGRRNRSLWQDHKSFLRALRVIREQLPRNAVVFGDFNQRQPRHRQPVEVEQLLLEAIGEEFKIVTSGKIPNVDELSIDHLACRPSLELRWLIGLPKTSSSIALSDHFGLSICLEPATSDVKT
jgi:endonuclease/exonuclease/phosphatase family metal-dependent hydrolase